jgi:transposase
MGIASEGRKEIEVDNLNSMVGVYEGPMLGEWTLKVGVEGTGSGSTATIEAPNQVSDLNDGIKGKLSPYLKMLQSWVESRPRAKIKEIYLILKDQGYSGSYDLVKKKIHTFRRELGRTAGAAFSSPEIPQAQVEFGKIALKGAGDFRAYLFTMVLGHSGRFHAELVENCDMATFLQCHQNAFESFGGVPKGIFYDPHESPMLRRLVGGYPFHLPVVDCGGHYGYTAQSTPPFASWMKGRLKRPAKILKKLFFPGYAFASLEAANADMLAWMGRYARQLSGWDRKEKSQREKMGSLPTVGFNFRGRRQYLKLRA